MPQVLKATYFRVYWGLKTKLPFGWEKVEDPHYGVYYIDHVNRRTQYENPVHTAKKQAVELTTQERTRSEQDSTKISSNTVLGHEISQSTPSPPAHE
ncbi:hypothetical protein RRG08_052441 [Elysia crispata]|uniref:WW domain-containing protein n=1 Tax=Elysia crispata TaxID=231223 RepID=A0AAE1B1G0_9GAST|nr:hypothetical protein RRG08_052441 [Elysia crispata]